VTGSQRSGLGVHTSISMPPRLTALLLDYGHRLMPVHTTPTWCDRQHIIFRFCEFRFESWRSRVRLAWYPLVRDEVLRAEIDSELPIFSHRLWINDQRLDSLRS
jgi:hypothetical protein